MTEYEPWIVGIQQDGSRNETRYFACSSVKKHLDETLAIKPGCRRVSGELVVHFSSPTGCRAQIKLDLQSLAHEMRDEVKRQVRYCV